MADYFKFDQFAEDVLLAKHNFASDVFKVMLTNSAPYASCSTKSAITEILSGNGYPYGGEQILLSSSISGGVARVAAAGPVVFTASGGDVGPFRWAVLYNSTPVSQPLIGWWDNGLPLTLGDTDDFRITPDAVNGIFQLS